MRLVAVLTALPHVNAAAYGHAMQTNRHSSRVGATTVEISHGLQVQVLQADGAFGTRLWGSSVALARWMADMDAAHSCPTALSGVRVLELGAGTGLVSMALQSLGADVLASDIDRAALVLIDQASKMQGLAVQTAVLNVCDTAMTLPSADLVVASDVLYTDELAEALAFRCMEALDAGATVVIADPGRPARSTFHSVLCAAGEGFVTSTGTRGFAEWLVNFQEKTRAERLLLVHVDARTAEEELGSE